MPKPKFQVRPPIDEAPVSFRIRKPLPDEAPLLPFAMDSGAFMFYTRHGAAKDETGRPMMGKGAHTRANHEYSQIPAFQRYFDTYCQFVKDYGSRFQFCASLDVIMNGPRSLELYREMKRQGLNVLPVYHYGEPVEILRAYLEDSETLGLGGLVKTDLNSRRQFLDRTWALLKLPNGEPRVRVHAFGMSSLEVIARHPYTSVDAVTPIHDGATGRVAVPAVVGDRYDYCASRMYVVLSDRSYRNRGHLFHLPHKSREAVDRYISEELAGLDLSGYFGRWSANLLFLQRAVKQASSRRATQCRFYMSGGGGPKRPSEPSCFQWLVDKGETSHLGFLGTFSEMRETQFQASKLWGFQFPPSVVSGAYAAYKSA